MFQETLILKQLYPAATYSRTSKCSTIICIPMLYMYAKSVMIYACLLEQLKCFYASSSTILLQTSTVRINPESNNIYGRQSK